MNKIVGFWELFDISVRFFPDICSAVKEDAKRTVEAKNGATLQGRKIKVEIAKRRAPLDQRRPLPNPKGQM